MPRKHTSLQTSSFSRMYHVSHHDTQLYDTSKTYPLKWTFFENRPLKWTWFFVIYDSHTHHLLFVNVACPHGHIPIYHFYFQRVWCTQLSTMVFCLLSPSHVNVWCVMGWFWKKLATCYGEHTWIYLKFLLAYLSILAIRHPCMVIIPRNMNALT